MHKVVTRLWHGDDKVVTRWWQFQNTRLLPPTYKVVTRWLAQGCYMVVITLLPGGDTLGFLLWGVLSTTYNSSRTLSWKIQESEWGTLIRLVWKNSHTVKGKAGRAVEMGNDWPPSLKSKERVRRLPPSKHQRNALRLQRFLEKKVAQQPQAGLTDDDTLLPCTVPADGRFLLVPGGPLD